MTNPLQIVILVSVKNIAVTETKDLLLNLQNKQFALGYSDQQFANLLGISRPLWTATRNKHRKVKFCVVRGAAKAFPHEFDDLIINYLRNGKD